MLMDECFDLVQPRLDLEETPHSGLFLTAPPCVLELKGCQLKLVHVALVGMSSRS